jgi:phytoene dehydrogenase-like protein
VRRLTEELFRGEGAGLLLGGSALHADLSPEGAGSGLYGWLLCCLGQRFGFPVPEGGAGGLTRALVRRLTAYGGEVVCGARVDKIMIQGGRAVGVRAAGDDVTVARRAVLADVSAPQLYLDLVGAEHLPPGFADDLTRFQWDTSTVKLDWSLNRPIPWTSPDAADAGTVHIADDFNNLTEFTAELAMGLLPSRPFLLLGQQSRADPTRSPPGTETAWTYTHVSRLIRGDGAAQIAVGPESRPEEWLPAFLDRIEDRIEERAPGFRASILGRHVFSPFGLEEADANLVGGAIGGGTAQLHQQLVLRPVPGAGRPETPVVNLYLASSSAHPGGGVHGACGANAARAALVALPRQRSALLGRGWWGRDRDPGRQG